VPKLGLRAFEESNMPIGLFFKQSEHGGKLFIVNDLLEPLLNHTFIWCLKNAAGDILSQGSQRIDAGSDSIAEIADIAYEWRQGEYYILKIILEDETGAIIAKNIYEDFNNHPDHPKGHSYRLSHETGARLYNA